MISTITAINKPIYEKDGAYSNSYSNSYNYYHNQPTYNTGYEKSSYFIDSYADRDKKNTKIRLKLINIGQVNSKNFLYHE
jgi:hypothetical protein